MSMLRDGAPALSSPFPLLPLRTGVLFPGVSMTLTVGRPRSIHLMRGLQVGDAVAVASQRDSTTAEPSLDDLHAYGTIVKVARVERQNDRAYRLTVEGMGRCRIDSMIESDPCWRVTAVLLEDEDAHSAEASFLAASLREQVARLAREGGAILSEESEMGRDPGALADHVAASLGLEAAKGVVVLAAGHVPTRLRAVLKFLGEAEALAGLRAKIEQDVRQEFGKHQREAVLREQLRAIRKELGEDTEGDEVDQLRQRLNNTGSPDEVQRVVERELKKLEGAGSQGPEANMIRTYLECLAELPWSKRADASLDLPRIATKLDDDHFGLDDVKKRVLEHIAVHKLSGNPRGTLLCFAGPPGVGKTSLGQSIADATGRPFARIALGGLRDEAEIRGHRRTYVGALPGRIIHALRKVGVKNPVILLDEIDKLGSGWGGIPEAALLEVLDPEQNKTFTDHYLEVPFDLSEIMFVCTANSLDNVSAPLRDRLEVIEIAGYIQEEKQKIARKHLIPKRMRDAGLGNNVLSITDAALVRIAQDYTREAGVRQLNRELTRLTRTIALEVARKTDDAPLRVSVDVDDLGSYLGKPRFRPEVAERTSLPGVATGLAWTPVGGDILFIETSKMPGKGRIEITGNLGDVMKESARAALSYVRSHAQDLCVDVSRLEDNDLHIHFPAGGVPKDGPSAGVTVFTALTSLLANRPVRADTAMTGECTLRGRVLPVGGIKAKVLAAHRAGIRRVILPRRNEQDLEDIPEGTRAEMDFILADDMSEVLAASLEPVQLAASFPDPGQPNPVASLNKPTGEHIAA